MAGVLAVLCAVVVTALATPAAANAHEGMCGGGGGGGGGQGDSGQPFTQQSATIPPPPYDPDCDLVGDGPSDPDGTGPVRAGPDNCPNTRNGDQTDSDADGQGDACDTDDDGDGVFDIGDNCRLVVNPGQEDANNDGRGDACPPVDSDGDGTFDDTDNCRSLPNPDQANTDGDRQGNACDVDDDDDYVADASDNCALFSNQDQIDRDTDGLGDACDPSTNVTSNPDPNPGGTDRRAPRISLRLARIQRLGDLLGGMATSVRCSEACAISGQLRRGRRTVARGTATLAGAGRTWLFLRLRKQVATRLVSGKRVRVTLRLTVKDSAGNTTRAARRVLLKR